MSVVNEHPNVNIRKLYAGQVATQVGMPVADLVAVAERGTRRPQLHTNRPRRRTERRENAEFVAIALLVQTWDEIAPWLVEELFADDVYRRAFVAIAEAGGSLNTALEQADPEARDVLERAAVVDLVVDVEGEARNLIGAAVRRQLATGMRSAETDQIRSDAEARLKLELLLNSERGLDTAGWLLGWLEARTEGRTGGV